MDSDPSDFAARNIESQVLHVAELAQAIRTNQVTLKGVPSQIPSDQIAHTYSIRSSVAQKQGRTDIAAQFLSLANQCMANTGLPCKVWVFEGNKFSYAAFELQPSASVAACIRFDGPFTQSVVGEA